MKNIDTPPRIHNVPRAIACAFAALCALAAPMTGFARTVYDAGAAFNDIGHNVNVFGPWSLWHASDDDLVTTSAFDATEGASGDYKGIGGSSSPYVRVNTSASAKISAGETVLPNEFFIHPANPSTATPSVAVRFSVPEDGWYSALVFVHDIGRETNNGSSDDSGIKFSIRAAGNLLVSQIVSQEGYTNNNPTVRFDFQMPVRWMTAGETIEAVIGNKNKTKNGHTSDATGLRFTVTKEDDGAFYDSGIAITNNLATRYETPYGTMAEGTWYYLLASAASSTSPLTNVSQQAVSRMSEQGVNGSLNGFFIKDRTTSSPYVTVNGTAASTASVAPGELRIHPHAGDSMKWPVVRFRPPVSGFYSASVVARDVARGTASGANGVDVYLYVADTLVTNTYVSLETFASTACLTFGSRLVAAGEPIDIVVSPSANVSSDATGVSAIFRRDASVADAGSALLANFAAASPAHPFADAAISGATWDIGYAADAAVTNFTTAAVEIDAATGTLGWRGYAYRASDGLSRICVATTGIAGVDGVYLSANSPLLAIAAGELFSQPYRANNVFGTPVARGVVVESGLYRIRAYARDIKTGSGDGIRIAVGPDGAVGASTAVSRESGTMLPYEAAADASLVWLRAGEGANVAIFSKVDAATADAESFYNDGTGFGACYVKTADAPESRVVNIDIGGGGAGRFSSFSGRGREGWSDWTRWNALRPGSSASASVENCREADGTTPRNVALSLARSSGAAISAASGATGCDLLDTGVSSTGDADGYSFTLSKLTSGAAYTLYLYGTGDAAFTVGGETKALEGQWFRADYEPCFARFEATADANGEIAGTFAASSASGAAFSGLTLVGEFPEYVPSAFIITLR